MLNYYAIQEEHFSIIIDQWESINFDTIEDQGPYVRSIWAAFSNAFYPDLSTYETLVNSGKINLVNFTGLFEQIFSSSCLFFNFAKINLFKISTTSKIYVKNCNTYLTYM